MRDRTLAFACLLVASIVIGLAAWGLISSVLRDRRFEDACRNAGGFVTRIAFNGQSSDKEACAITLVPRKDSIISAKY